MTIEQSTSTFMTFDGTLYMYKDVSTKKHNCALEALCQSGLLPNSVSPSELTRIVHNYMLTEGLGLARTLFSQLTANRNQMKSLEDYLDKIDKKQIQFGAFEINMTAFKFKLKIVTIQCVEPLKINNTDETFASIFSNWEQCVEDQRTICLLHHQMNKPFQPCKYEADLNHYAILIPVKESSYKALVDAAWTILYSKKRKKHTLTNINQIMDTANKRTKRSNSEIRQSEQDRNTKLRKSNRLKKHIKDRDNQHLRDSRAKAKNQKTTNVSKTTGEILNHLTDASLTSKEQDLLLQPLHVNEIYFALNKFTEMMGEKNLPTVLCAVCACKHIPSEVKRLAVNDIPSFILLTADSHHRTLDITKDWVLLNDALFQKSSSKCVLSKDVNVQNIGECEIDICKTCLQELTAGTIPIRSLASFDTGYIPKELQPTQLTFAERMFLSVNMTIFNVFRVENPGKKNVPSECKARVSKGHCISFKHSDTNEVIEKHILPHLPETLPKLMITSFIGPAETAEEAKRMVQEAKQLTLRTKVVHEFAKQYARLNPTRIRHDPSRLSEHVSGTVPDTIIQMLNYDALVERTELERPTFVELDEAIHDDYAKRDHLRPGEEQDPSVQVLQTNGMVVPHLLSNGIEELRTAGLSKLYGNVLAIPTEKTPVSDYDPLYFVNNYPNIFIHGVGERPPHVPLEIYLSTIMERPNTGAAIDYSFPFEARNVLLRHRTLKKVRLSITVENSSIIPDINDGDFADALRAIKTNHPVNNRVQTLMNQLKITGADLRGTPQKLNRYRQQILAGLYPLFGPFDVWITLNIQESSSQVVLRIAGKQEIPISYEVPDNVPNISRRMQICAENPMAVAKFFHIFMKAFLDALMGLPHNVNDLTPTHKGLLGWVQAYMFVLEVSGKATGPHAHGQIKVRGLNREKLLNRFHDPTFLAIYRNFMEAAFTQDLPNTQFDVIPPSQGGKQNDLIRSRRAEEELFRCVEPQLIDRAKHYMGMYPLPRLPLNGNQQMTEDYLSKRLIQIVRECGIHEHSATCAKNGHVGDDTDCRMSYPQPLNEEIQIDLDEHFEKGSTNLVVEGIDVKLARDHPFMVAINKWVTVALASNTVVYYMPTGREGRTKALYITNYSTKKPLSTYECIALFRASMQARRRQQKLATSASTSTQNEYFSSCSVVNRCLNALSSEIIVTGYECCADIANFPDHYSSNLFVPFSGWSYMYNMLGEKTNQHFHIVPKHDKQNNNMKTTLVSLVEDYIHLDIPDEKKMTVYEFVAFYKRRLRRNQDPKNKTSDNSNSESNSDEDKTTSFANPANPPMEKRKPGRPMHERIGFKQEHKLSKTHYALRMAKMKVPYQVGRQYPKKPRVCDESTEDQQDLYAKYILSIFKPWSRTMPVKPDKSSSWWSTLVKYLGNCPSWIPTIVRNMEISLERDETKKKTKNNTERISSNTMNHADSKFEREDDEEQQWILSPEEATELLQELESEIMMKGVNLTRATFTLEQQFVCKGMQSVSTRFKLDEQPLDTTGKQPSYITVNNNYFIRGNTEDDYPETTFASSSKAQLSDKVIRARLSKWDDALKKLVACNESGIDYIMDNNNNNITNTNYERSNKTLPDNVSEKLESLLIDPTFVERPVTMLDSQFQKTKFRPSWDLVQSPPTILETITAWNLTKRQAKFAILVLNHFHETIAGRNPKQLLAKCLGAPGTGKSQTLLAILWHISQHNKHDSVATCAFTGGAAMLISTPYTKPMTTHRQFQIKLKGPGTTERIVQILTRQVGNLQYVFVDEFSFLSYRHIKHIAEQIAVALGQRTQKDKPFSGMNMVFFGDYEQLANPKGYPMYYGASAEESLDPEDMNMWFTLELQKNIKNASYDPNETFLGRMLWTSIDTIQTLNVQKRQGDTTSGRRLLARCQALRDESFTPQFFDDLQEKAIGMKHGPDLASKEWSNPLYIVMRHALRIPIDFNEAKFQANLRSKRFICWRTQDTLMGKALPPQLQLVVDTMQIGKISKWQYFYHGMPMAFTDNKYFDAGNATNNMGYTFDITLNTHEPPDDLSKPFRTLKYLPEYVLVYVPNSRVQQLCPDLPQKVIPMKPERQYKNIRLGDDRYNLTNGKRISTISITRIGMRWAGVHAVTQFFSQGMSLAGRKCIIDLRIPPGSGKNKNYAQSIMVMLSRHKDDDDWALLHPLWPPGNRLERSTVIHNMTKSLQRNIDLKAELRRVNQIETTTTEKKIQVILNDNQPLLAFLEVAQ